MAVPGSRGTFQSQAEELLAQVLCILRRQPYSLTPTTLMVFLRDPADEAAGRQLVQTAFGDAPPVSTFVVQPPACGAALGIELWAAGGAGVTFERFGPDVLSVHSDGIRWIHSGGVHGAAIAGGCYAEASTAFALAREHLARAGVGFEHVVRTWIYVNQITEGEPGRQRYQELNRARTDFYRNLKFGATLRRTNAPTSVYPASTGIGTRGTQIALACLALESSRPDVFLQPLENPHQKPACAYEAGYSPQSPKFARGMAVVQGQFVSTLVSGTASIVDSRTVFPGDVMRQTAQTLDNIEQLIGPENFARHGLAGAGATLKDIAKLRVYVKHLGDYERCREVVEGRLPHVPAIYLHADVCRPDLLVEVEAVAFSPFTGESNRRRATTTHHLIS